MNWLDISIIVFIVVGMLVGVKDGFVKQLFSIGGLLLGFFFAFKFFRFLTRPLIEHWHLSPAFAVIVSVAFIVVVVNIIVQIIYYFAKGKESSVTFISRVLGGVLGLLQSAVVLSFMLLGLSFYQFPAKEIREESRFYASVLHIAPMLLDSGSVFTIPIEEDAPQDTVPTSL
ncbi:MAG: CvpA family protein [Bacteroidota bacterium]